MKLKGIVWYTAPVSVFFAWLLLMLFPGISPRHVWLLVSASRNTVVDLIWMSAFIAAIIACVCLVRSWRGYFIDDPTKGRTPRIIDDRPITSDGDDRFKRGHMADVLAQELALPHGGASVVVGLEGPWGSGKSSLLALVEKRLADMMPKPVVVHFNPWILGAVGDLVDTFFRQLADECAAQRAAPDLVSAFDQFRREVERERVAGLMHVALQVWQFISRLVRDPTDRRDLLSRREAVSDLVDRMGRSVVVIVDDVDRLPPDQIRSVFQLIKSIGDLNRVAYIIAYDPVPVYAALDFGMTGFGKSYKDKIVQVTVPFPREPYSERKAYVHAIVMAAALKWNTGIRVEEQQLLESALPVLTRVLSTPRQVKVAVNQAFLLAALLDFEIAFADLVAFGALGVRFPEVVGKIRRQPTLVTRRDLLDEEYLSTDYFGQLRKPKVKEKVEDPLQASLADIYSDPVDRDQVAALLHFLFPEKIPEDSQTLNRLRAENNFLLLLYCGVRGSLFSNDDVDKVISSAVDRDAILDQYDRDGALLGLLAYTTTRIGSQVDVAAVETLLSSLVTRAKETSESVRGEIVDDVARFALSILVNAGNSVESKLAALRAVVLDEKFLSPGEELIARVLNRAGLWKEGVWLGPGQRRDNRLEWLTDEDAEALREDWLRVVSNCPVDLLMRREPRVIGILHRRGQLAPNDYSDVKRDLGAWLAKSKTNVFLFAQSFPAGTSFSGTDKLVPDDLDLVSEFIAAGVPARQIERLQEDCPEIIRKGRTNDGS